MSETSLCRRHRRLGEPRGAPARHSWVAPECCHRSKPRLSRPFSGSLPARRMTDSAPRRWSRRAGGDRNLWGLTFDNDGGGEQ